MRKGLINEKDTAIYQFGWQVSIEIFISIIASVGIALYLKMFPEMIFLGGIFIPLLESGRIDHSESDRNSQFELNRNSQCTLAN